MSLIAKPLLAVLLATGVLTVLVLLQPVAAPVEEGGESLLAERRSTLAPRATDALAWQRTLTPPPKVQTFGFAPPPPPPPPKPIAVVVAPPPKPTAPQPAFRYLGRLVQDGRTYVFLGQGDDVEAVPLGGTFAGTWRIEAITGTGVELKYLPLDETRQLALSE
jgi:hypothetical protein